MSAFLRTVQATRYVTPLREGGSLPAIVEADDLGLYVVKFRGAGQGPLALVSELVGGEVGRALGLPVPELVFIDVDAALGRNEPDQEIADLISGSVGLNLALDYLPGSLMFNIAAGDRIPAALASCMLWFDALITNVDRTVRNPNLLLWHREPYLIDHGAALYFHHNWPATGEELAAAARSPFTPVRNHLLAPYASELESAARAGRKAITPQVITSIANQIPESWLPAPVDRSGYSRFLMERLAAHEIWEQAAQQAHDAARF